MMPIRKSMFGLLAALLLAPIDMAAAAMPFGAGIETGQGNVVEARVVCGPAGCFEDRPPPPPGWGGPPPPGWHRPPPPPPRYRPPPPPPPPGYYRPPSVYAPVRPSYGSAHVRWCLGRYRSYNPSTDTYVGYDGRYHRCYSPY